MFKLVVLCAFVAAAVAEPEPAVLQSIPLLQPYAAYSTVVSPASTSISSQSSSVVHPTPLTYSAPLAFSHFIKKRSPQFLAPAYNPFGYVHYNTAPVVSTAPVVHTPAITYTSAALPVAAHLIKKRSAPLLPASYIAPTTYVANAHLATPYIANPYLQTQYYTNAHLPLVNAHLIKKRSAAFLPTTYLTPSTYINTIPTTSYLSAPLIHNTLYTAPASIPLATTHLIKKRSADPQTLVTVPSVPTTYYAGSPFISTYNPTTLIKSAPIYTANPFVYSTFIKK